MNDGETAVGRRFFLKNAGSRMAVLGAAVAASAPAGTAQSNAGARWQPPRHTQDDWLDQISGQHRFVFDTTTAAGMNSALLFANNYYIANASGYGLKDSDLAVVIVTRHLSTPFAYNDSIWAKYGEPISNFVDRTKEPSKKNMYLSQIDALVKRGAHVAVCQMATRALAGSIARATGGSTDDIYNEISANLVGNSHLVAAGIVAVNRAQERGYAFVYGA
jgi:intracellular sulfur oxidation DsrE/DsrF family protein